MPKRTLFEQAHEEFKVTRQVSTGNGSLYCGQTGVRGENVPGWFVRDELGYDGPVGYRLYEMIPQERLEERHREAASAEDVPPPQVATGAKARRRETKHSRRAKLEQLEARALAMRYAA